MAPHSTWKLCPARCGETTRVKLLERTQNIAVQKAKGLEPEWRRLAERRGNAFLTPDWSRCWFEHYGEEAIPFNHPLRAANGRLRGVLPLAIGRSGHPRVCRITGSNLGDRFHPVCEPSDELEVAAAAGEALASTAEPWSVLSLDHVEVERPWVTALAEATGLRLTTREHAEEHLPLIDIARHSGWDDYLASRSSNFRQQIRRYRRRAAKKHSLRIRRTERPEDLGRDIDVFFDLHDRRQASHGESSLTSPRARAFHADFAAAALKSGWLRLWFLELDERTVASFYGWRLGNRYAYYNSGFDPDWSHLSPGFVLLSAVIESAFEEGATEFDFLQGDEPYKFRFAERSRSVSNLSVARSLPHPASLVATAEQGARRIGRHIPGPAQRKLGLTRSSLLSGKGR
jgi:CelD/BcsL family acetyltransferase involved in cellulose biosynthesis